MILCAACECCSLQQVLPPSDGWKGGEGAAENYFL